MKDDLLFWKVGVAYEVLFYLSDCHPSERSSAVSLSDSLQLMLNFGIYTISLIGLIVSIMIYIDRKK
ncbi:putative holin-like toxin [Companilactobacillus nantensis]|uniref:putative holin-like toxin n=1 Tax=Companilactobacillus nantensis TaxID=305793 RepID=UPI0009F874B7